jgi:G3E family GTPase
MASDTPTTDTTTNPPRIPVNLIAGSLGVGKTTAINHLLGQRPAKERWAVLVNEYGQIGLDAALLEESNQREGVNIKEVAGGCICCTAGVVFQFSLVLLLQRRPDRLLIEPTGLATLSGILDTLAQPGIREAVDVRSIISLVDPARLDEDALPVEARDQIEAADILLANRCDLASPAQLDAFEAWADRIFPPKRLIRRVERGQLPLELLDLVTQRAPADPPLADESAHHRHHVHSRDAATSGHSHDAPTAVECGPTRPVVSQSHDSPLASTFGWAIWAEQVFDERQVARWLEQLTTRQGLRRVKAVLHTNGGWCSFNIADGASETKPSAYRRDSRLELVWMGPSRPDPAELEKGLLSCLVSD